MNVDEFAEMLPKATDVDGQFYPWADPTGYRVTFRVADEWYWFSVSNTRSPVTPLQVAAAITAKDRHIKRSNLYKGGKGFEATVRSGDHWYMLGHGNNRK